MATLITPHATHRPGAHDVRNAWLALMTVPVAIVGAFVVGEGLTALLGYSPHGESAPPWWVIIIAATPALTVSVIPAAAALRFARRAAAERDRRGLIPAGIAVALTGLFILTNLVAAIWG